MRYLIEFDSKNLDFEETDILVIGSGIAGLSAAFECASNFKTTVISKSEITDTATWYAQGGIASAISSDDSIELHYKDTIKTGLGLCDPKMVRTIINESLGAISFLRNIGTEFDEQNSKLDLALEGGHSKARILHKKDYTGSEVQNKLTKSVLDKKGIKLIENVFSLDLLTDRNDCLGVIVKKGKKEWIIFAKAVILATGGAGQLYNVTTNPDISTGDGVAMSYRAGAKLMDMEFIQFHPTALHTKKNPRFLISEALRGEGAYIRDINGERFLKKINDRAELLPRDILAKALFEQIEKQKEKYVYLDATHISSKVLINNYPNIYNNCKKAGIDITSEPIPVSPAAHFMIGGIKTGANGETSIFNLFASGECAATGFHGANRLASNSLLEGVVMSRRIARHLSKIPLKLTKKHIVAKRYARKEIKSTSALKNEIRNIMQNYVSTIRSEETLEKALAQLKDINMQILDSKLRTKTHFEAANLAQLARVITECALKRKESRGVHLRKDYPKTSAAYFKNKVVKRSV